MLPNRSFRTFCPKRYPSNSFPTHQLLRFQILLLIHRTRAYLLRKYVAAPRFSPWRRDGTTAQYARRSDWRVGSNKRAALTAQSQDRSKSGPDQDHERVQAVKRADLQKRRRAEPRKRLRPEKAPFVRTILSKKSRRRSTLPHSHPCSTIDAKELNFRVRDGIGCGLFAIITGKI